LTRVISEMSDDDTSENKKPDQIAALREVLLGPVVEEADKRHAHVMKVLQEISTVLAARIEDLEAQVESLTKAVETERHDFARGIGDAVAGLGQQLRELGARAHDTDLVEATKKAKAATARRRRTKAKPA